MKLISLFLSIINFFSIFKLNFTEFYMIPSQFVYSVHDSSILPIQLSFEIWIIFLGEYFLIASHGSNVLDFFFNYWYFVKSIISHGFLLFCGSTRLVDTICWKRIVMFTSLFIALKKLITFKKIHRFGQHFLDT